jgi:hypothetical protein
VSQKVVFISGAPGSGKDTTAEILVLATARVVEHVKFAAVVKAMANRLYGMPPLWEPTQDEKDQPSEQFYGITPRQAYIAVSEAMIKPLHGQDFFGRALLREMNSRSFASAFVISDSGFQAEAVPIVERYGAANCLIVRMHREGHTFANDSRGDLASLRRVLQSVIDWIEAAP